MRTIIDSAGRRWDVVLGKESYGTLVMLFSPRGGGEVRKSVLAAESTLEAEREMAALSDDDLREQLERASSWR